MQKKVTDDPTNKSIAYQKWCKQAISLAKQKKVRYIISIANNDSTGKAMAKKTKKTNQNL
jgi:hypothetical protein